MSSSPRVAGDWARRLWWLAVILVGAAGVYLLSRLTLGADPALARELLPPLLLALAGGGSAIVASFLGRRAARRRLADAEGEARRQAEETDRLVADRARLQDQAERLGAEAERLAGDRERLEVEAERARADEGRLERALVDAGRALNIARAERSAAEQTARETAERAQADLAERDRRIEQLEADARHEREEHQAALEARDTVLAERDRAHEETRSRLEAELESVREELAQQQQTARQQQDRAERRDREKQQWVDQLRSEVHRLQRQYGVLPDASDLPALILRTAVTLLQAEKGILLSREDEDHDGDLELLASVGFEHDPERSMVAQRFAGRVIERDRIIREDDPTAPDTGDSATPADREIRNLLAIPVYVLDEFRGVVIAANREGGFEELDEEVLVALGGQAGALMQNARLQDRLRRSHLATVRVLADAMEAKDGSLRGHGTDVARYATAVAARMGLDRRQQQEVALGSLLHDVGKIGVSELILLKPGPLTPEEAGIIRLHPRIGSRLVEQVPELGALAPAILHHHERFDGRGYPSGLRGEEIPREARIITVSDAFSAMTSDRPYRPRISFEQACEELRRHAGTQFDPEIVSVFVSEVLASPPADAPSTLGIALDDPEVRARREQEASVLGYAEFALTDSLTLLYSHRYLREVLAAHVQRARLQGVPCALVLLELTGIADLNLRAGYAAGDAALRSAARTLQALASRVAGIACRESGRRLAVVMPYGDEAAATNLARELVLDLMDGVGVRASVAVWREGDSADDLLERARMGLGGLGRGS